LQLQYKDKHEQEQCELLTEHQFFAINSAKKTEIKNLDLGNTLEVLLHLSALAILGAEKLMTENIIYFSDKVIE
jgi:hypothetical protein